MKHSLVHVPYHFMFIYTGGGRAIPLVVPELNCYRLREQPKAREWVTFGDTEKNLGIAQGSTSACSRAVSAGQGGLKRFK